jgi:hypothetical protein
LICLPCPCGGEEIATKETAASKEQAGPAPVPGFRVPLPEVSINRILGRKPHKKKVVPDKPGAEVVPDEKHPLIEPDTWNTQPSPPSKEPTVRRLPFEPLPVEPLHRPPPGRDQPDTGPTPAVIGVPSAPEHPLEAPTPRKALLRSKAVLKIPKLLTIELAGERPVPLRTAPEALQEIPASDRIQMQSRPGMEGLRPREPEPHTEAPPEPAPERFPNPTSEPEFAPEPEAQPEPQPKIEPAPDPASVENPEPWLPAPTSVVPPAQEPRTIPETSQNREFDAPPESAPDPQPSDEPVQDPEESATVEELPEPPAAEEPVASPLADNLIESREVLDYVKATMPVLEELSLLMTRVPTLKVEDFDPSDANAPVVPSDIAVKMDSMKRRLQILDSKTFAIIPPQDFTRFHSMIRESITESYRACEAIVNFFNERNHEDLKRVREHLEKARALIRKTTRGNGRPETSTTDPVSARENG